MSKHRKIKSRKPLTSIRYLSAGAAWAAAASAGLVLALPPDVVSALASPSSAQGFAPAVVLTSSSGIFGPGTRGVGR